MASSTAMPARHDDIDNYDAGDLSDDPFASPPPDSAAKKRKANGDGGLGIDEEVSVQKRARVPNVKLDEDRLLGPAGIPKLKARAASLKIKGKGHEFSDAARLLSFYQLWLDDLFPKARFLDALAMVEKAGHKKRLASARNEWISQRSKQTDDDDENTEENTRSAAHFSAAVNGTTDKPSTPLRDVPDDDDLYDATPRAARQTAPPADVPEDDDLDALMAEAEANDRSKRSDPTSTGHKASGEDNADELDALIAEAEGTSNGSEQVSNGDASKKPEGSNDDFADEEAAMQEMDGLW
ncbi:Swi3-domain-containing protein [Sarocladium strictum]